MWTSLGSREGAGPVLASREEGLERCVWTRCLSRHPSLYQDVSWAWCHGSQRRQQWLSHAETAGCHVPDGCIITFAVSELDLCTVPIVQTRMRRLRISLQVRVGTRIRHKVFGKSLDPEMIEGSWRLVCETWLFQVGRRALEARTLRMSDIR